MNLWDRLVSFLNNEGKGDFVYKYLKSTLDGLNTANVLKQEELVLSDYYLKTRGY